MLHFHRTASAPPNYFAWRQQRKLLLRVMMIGLPLIVALRAWEFWHEGGANRLPQPVAAGAKIDPRLPEPQHSLPTLDAFTAEPVAELVEPNDLQAEPGKRDQYFRGVIPEYLRSVRDDTPSRTADQDACFNLLQALHRATSEELKAASLGNATYVQLYQQPDAYRGKLVDLKGTVRRAFPVPLAKNHTGLTDYYQLWLFTEGSGTNPIIVYAIELPEGFPTGKNLYEPVNLTGFFFKRLAYSAKGGAMTAPMLLAKTVEWKAPSPKEQAAAVDQAGQRMQWLLATAAVGIVVLTLVMWQLNRSMRRPLRRPAEMSVDAVAALKNAETATVEEELRRMAREEE